MYTDSLLLLSMSISTWNQYAFDRSASAELRRDKQAADGALRVNKKLLSGSAPLKKTLAAFAAVRTYLYSESLPWGENSDRVIPTMRYLDFVTGFNDRVSEAQQQLDIFLGSYPAEILADRAAMGAVYDPALYPSLVDMRSRFSVRLAVLPVPTVNDFRVTLADGVIADLTEQAEQSIQSAKDRAQQEIISRFCAPLQHFLTRMADIDAGDRELRLHNSVTVNIANLAHELESWNFTGNPEFSALQQQLARLGQYNVEQLKSDTVARVDATNQAQNLIDAFSALGTW